MILDSENGWLFVKTGKVGGTSVEIALSRLASESAIITPNMPGEEELRRRLGYRTARGHQLPLRRYTMGQLLRRAIKGRKPEHVFWDHIGLDEIKERIGAQRLGELFKFSIVRNPFDEAVSRWRWYGKRFGEDKVGSFGRFIFDQPESIVSNRLRTSINGENAVDAMVRFEHMADDFRNLSGRLGLDEKFFRDLEEIKLKSGSRGAVLPTPAEVFASAPGAEDLVRLLSQDVIKSYGYVGPSGGVDKGRERV